MVAISKTAGVLAFVAGALGLVLFRKTLKNLFLKFIKPGAVSVANAFKTGL